MSEPPGEGTEPTTDEAVPATEAGSVGFDKFGVSVSGKDSDEVNDRAGRLGAIGASIIGLLSFVGLLSAGMPGYGLLALVASLAVATAIFFFGRGLAR